jgi:hypothetical protein
VPQSKCYQVMQKMQKMQLTIMQMMAYFYRAESISGVSLKLSQRNMSHLNNFFVVVREIAKLGTFRLGEFEQTSVDFSQILLASQTAHAISYITKVKFNKLID